LGERVRAAIATKVGPAQSRAILARRLQARRGEITQVALERLHSISALSEVSDPAYAEGLRTAVDAAVDFGLGAIERSSDQSISIPAEVLIQARMAARSGVSLDTVLRRCFAGYTLLGDFIMGEAEEDGLLGEVALKELLRVQAAIFDRLMAAVTEDYIREAGSRPDSTEEQRVERVRRLLDGEMIDATELAYDFDAHHLGAIARGDGAWTALRDLATTLDRRLLAIRLGEGTVWAWLGGRCPLEPAQVRDLASRWPSHICVAIGEPADGLLGWRLTYRQARAALPIALRGPESVVRYADVALLASVIQDELLATSLHRIYLAPLQEERDGGEVARDTLRAYFAAERNVSSAAAALGVNRHTIASRLRAIERRLGLSIGHSALHFEAALRMSDLGAPALQPTTLSVPEEAVNASGMSATGSAGSTVRI
jgi:hypothetical protein